MERSYLSLQRALCCAKSLHNFDMSLLQNRVTEIQTTAQVGLHYRCAITFSYTTIQKFLFYSASYLKKKSKYNFNVSVTNDRSEARVDPLAALLVQGQIGKNQAVVSRAT